MRQLPCDIGAKQPSGDVRRFRTKPDGLFVSAWNDGIRAALARKFRQISPCVQFGEIGLAVQQQGVENGHARPVLPGAARVHVGGWRTEEIDVVAGENRLHGHVARHPVGRFERVAVEAADGELAVCAFFHDARQIDDVFRDDLAEKLAVGDGVV